MTRCDQLSDDKPRVLLSLNQAAVIILMSSGVIYQNVTGGYSCIERCAEGVLVPLVAPYLIISNPHDIYECPIERQLVSLPWNSRECYNPSEGCADKIDQILKTNGFSKNIVVNRSRLEDSTEAWVHVHIEPLELANYQGFDRSEGILVWPNSD